MMNRIFAKNKEQLINYIFGFNFSLLIIAIVIKVLGGFRPDEFPIIITTLIPICTLYLGHIAKYISEKIKSANHDIDDKEQKDMPFKGLINTLLFSHFTCYLLLIIGVSYNKITIEELVVFSPMIEGIYAFFVGIIIPALFDVKSSNK